MEEPVSATIKEEENAPEEVSSTKIKICTSQLPREEESSDSSYENKENVDPITFSEEDQSNPHQTRANRKLSLCDEAYDQSG